MRNNVIIVRAHLGEADAQYYLGAMYKNGYGVVQNNNEAIRWYSKAAMQGHSGAQSNLDVTYYNAKGIGENTPERRKKRDRYRHEIWG
ncbi:MAG: sel1 repeat family protein [Deltaproteobacteria bacterium]|nr:sel1 repeat family protein [Deltaproteobacteria bacterium]